MKKYICIIVLLISALFIPATFAEVPSINPDAYPPDVPLVTVGLDGRGGLELHSRGLNDVSCAAFLASHLEFGTGGKFVQIAKNAGISLVPPGGKVTSEWARDTNSRLIALYYTSGLNEVIDVYALNFQNNASVIQELNSPEISDLTVNRILAGEFGPGTEPGSSSMPSSFWNSSWWDLAPINDNDPVSGFNASTKCGKCEPGDTPPAGGVCPGSCIVGCQSPILDCVIIKAKAPK